MNIFSVGAETQDIEILLSNVEQAITQWEDGKTPILDLSVMLGESGKLTQQAQRLKNQWNLNSWEIIQSTRQKLGPWIIRFQHVVRKLTWWYLEPIIQQIRSFQMNTAMTVDGLARNHEQLLHQLDDVTNELIMIKKQLAQLETNHTENTKNL